MIDKKISNYVKPLTYTYIRLREAKQNENRQENKKTINGSKEKTMNEGLTNCSTADRQLLV